MTAFFRFVRLSVAAETKTEYTAVTNDLLMRVF